MKPFKEQLRFFPMVYAVLFVFTCFWCYQHRINYSPDPYRAVKYIVLYSLQIAFALCYLFSKKEFTISQLIKSNICIVLLFTAIRFVTSVLLGWFPILWTDCTYTIQMCLKEHSLVAITFISAVLLVQVIKKKYQKSSA